MTIDKSADISNVTDVERLRRRVENLPALAAAKAVWLLDIDGVLNVIGTPPYGQWDDYRVSWAAFDGFGVELLYSPTLVKLLNQLYAKGIVHFRWTTTWTYDGPRNFAPAVGLHIGADVCPGADMDDLYNWWKFTEFQRTMAEGRPVIWTDDDIETEPKAVKIASLLHPDEATIICPATLVGLTPSEVGLILDTLERLIAA